MVVDCHFAILVHVSILVRVPVRQNLLEFMIIMSQGLKPGRGIEELKR